MSQGLFDAESNDDDEDDDEEGMVLPSGASKDRKTAKEKRKTNERKKEVNVTFRGRTIWN
jgi:hypothetical protein